MRARCTHVVCRLIRSAPPHRDAISRARDGWAPDANHIPVAPGVRDDFVGLVHDVGAVDETELDEHLSNAASLRARKSIWASAGVNDEGGA
jgi:hypothetical protein